jgi:predicted small secreted protein
MLKQLDAMYKTGLICLILAALFLAGCNTVEGMGKDIKKGGQAIEDAAD